MLAILGGFGAAVAWAVSTLCSSRSTRMIGSSSAVAWISVTGLVLLAPAIAAAGVPAHLGGSTLAWLVLAGAGNVLGLLAAYAAYRVGDVSLIAPVIATEGAIAAVLALALGEHISVSTGVTLAVIAVGVTLAAIPGSSSPTAAPAARILPLAGLAALCFGTGLYATGRVSSQLPVAWVVLSARVLATIVLALPLALSGRLRITRRAAPLVVISGVCEVLGYVSFTLGARHDIAVAAVLSTQFAAISAVGAYLLFRERLARAQLVGVVVLLIGVSTLSGLRG